MSWRLTALAPLLAGLLMFGPAASGVFAQEFGPPPGGPATAPAPVPARPPAPALEDAFRTIAPLIPERPAPSPAGAAPTPEDVAAYGFDNFLIFICAVLVLFMQAGFAMVEAGFNSSKHTVNILFKNVLDLAVGALIYFAVGYHLMYPGDASPIVPGYFGAIDFGIDGSAAASGTPGAAITVPGTPGRSAQVDWFFQVAFAATAATIVSGAVAGRLKFGAYMIYSAVITALVYPTIGYWKWGGGWLNDIGFYDFAGSGVVHATGGFAGLAGAIMLGPRIGRYAADGKPVAIPGHSLPLATLGVFILLVGWFGFNPGSQLALYGKGNTNAIALIAVNTALAACAGCVVSTFLSWILFSKPDLSMALNGMLAGLVGITANCDGVTNGSATVIGAVAGVVVVGGIILLDKLRIDDPVGAFPVHGLCGVWGLLAVAIFGHGDYWNGSLNPPAKAAVWGNWTAQITGSLAIPLFAFFSMLALFALLKAVGFLRVSAEEEERGLDISEHGMSAYAA